MYNLWQAIYTSIKHAQNNSRPCCFAFSAPMSTAVCPFGSVPVSTPPPPRVQRPALKWFARQCCFHCCQPCCCSDCPHQMRQCRVGLVVGCRCCSNGLRQYQPCLNRLQQNRLRPRKCENFCITFIN